MLSGVAPSLIPSQVDTKGLRDNQGEGPEGEGGEMFQNNGKISIYLGRVRFECLIGIFDRD